jgi:type II secretory pathway predicted ATPase ExeA
MTDQKTDVGQPGLALSAEEQRELEVWRTKRLHFELPVHSTLEHQMKIAMEGVESAALIGRPGCGKTHSVEELTRRVNALETRNALAEDREPRSIYTFTAGRTGGRKTALSDLYQALLGERPPSGPKAPSARQLTERLALQFAENAVHLVCIDEAQLIDPMNLDHLRQIPDRARDHEHRMGLLFVGTPELRDNLAKTGQLGQRVATVISLKPFARPDVGPLLSGFHPHLGPLQRELPKRQWKELEDELFAKAGNNFRRLTTIIANANEFCITFRRRMDAEILRFAIGKLEPEA